MLLFWLLLTNNENLAKLIKLYTKGLLKVSDSLEEKEV